MNREIAFILNDGEVRNSLPPGRVLLDLIRREKHLTGTREGCREGDCGAYFALLAAMSAFRHTKVLP